MASRDFEGVVGRMQEVCSFESKSVFSKHFPASPGEKRRRSRGWGKLYQTYLYRAFHATLLQGEGRLEIVQSRDFGICGNSAPGTQRRKARPCSFPSSPHPNCSSGPPRYGQLPRSRSGIMRETEWGQRLDFCRRLMILPRGQACLFSSRAHSSGFTYILH